MKSKFARLSRGSKLLLFGGSLLLVAIFLMQGSMYRFNIQSANAGVNTNSEMQIAGGDGYGIEGDTNAGEINLTASNFRLEDGALYADICFERPSSVDWNLAQPVLAVNGETIPAFVVGLLGPEYAPGQGNQQRCDFVGFTLEGIGDFVDFRITVPRLEVAESEALDCEGAQRVLDVNDSGITIQCVIEEGYSGYEVIERPASISDEDMFAEILTAFREAEEKIVGPWILPGQLP